MARYRDAVCRLCRREGMKLFLKGSRCHSEKCAVERRSYPPGQHGKRRQKVLGYGLQLREKQKVKRIYGILERQFHGYYEKATRGKGVTGLALLQYLERRLDNVVYRMGLSTSRAESRLLVGHGHIDVNGRRVDIPSFLVHTGDVVSVRDKSRKNPEILASIEAARGRGIPEWLEFQPDAFTGKILKSPERIDVNLPVEEQLIVELYSK